MKQGQNEKRTFTIFGGVLLDTYLQKSRNIPWQITVSQELQRTAIQIMPKACMAIACNFTFKMVFASLAL